MGYRLVKYMGSKRTMLRNGLGELLSNESRPASRVIDLFCGASSVSWFAATKLGKPVVACDLQKYATILAGSVIKRTEPTSLQKAMELWLLRAVRTRLRLRGWREAEEIDTACRSTETWRRRAQEFCSSNVPARSSVVCRFYGGHYFSPTQALSFDAMLRTIPEDHELGELCLAATIIAASNCAASPGHTAQPFKATITAEKYLQESWLRNPMHYAQGALKKLCPLHASHRGETFVADANRFAENLKPTDIVFIDPPYSAVQYSRFYHVLETIARGTCSDVKGVGRYPPLSERPNSCYSRKSESAAAIEDLFRVLSANGCTVVLTFPQAECSNGLSGDKLEETARLFFHVKRRSVRSRFSTLGGNKVNRSARETSNELMLLLKSK